MANESGNDWQLWNETFTTSGKEDFSPLLFLSAFACGPTLGGSLVDSAAE